MKKLFRLVPLLLALALLALFAVQILFPGRLYCSAESSPVLLGELPGIQKKFTLMEEALLEDGGVTAAGRGDWLMLVCDSADMEELLAPAAGFSAQAEEVLLLTVVPGEDGAIESSRVYRYSDAAGSGSWNLVAFGSGESKVRTLDQLRGGSLSAMLLIAAGVLLVLQIPVSAVSRRRDRKPDRCAPDPDGMPGPGGIPPMEHRPQFPLVKIACGMLMLLSAAGLILLGWGFLSGAFATDPAGLLLAAVMCVVLMTFALTTLAGIRRGEPSRGRNAGVLALTLVLMVFLALVAYSVFS